MKVSISFYYSVRINVCKTCCCSFYNLISKKGDRNPVKWHTAKILVYPTFYKTNQQGSTLYLRTHSLDLKNEHDSKSLNTLSMICKKTVSMNIQIFKHKRAKLRSMDTLYFKILFLKIMLCLSRITTESYICKCYS